MPQSEFWPFSRNQVPSNNVGESSVLQQQLGDMEGAVKEIQMELAAIKRDRLDLYNIKQTKPQLTTEDGFKGLPFQHRDDKYPKFSDVSKIREELIKAKNAADEEKFQREKYELKLKDLETKLNSICCVEKMNEAKKQADTEIANLKCNIRDLREENDELKLTVNEKNEQLHDYRAKYLQAQQQVEELRRQLDIVDYDNKQVSDQIQLEIQKMKMQFQEKLQELAPLPDLLKGAQIQLQEAKQFQKLAEDSSQQLSNELLRVKEKLITAVNNYNQEKVEKAKLVEEYKELKCVTDEKQKEIDELYTSIDDFKCTVLRLQEKLTQLDLRFEEKSGECAHLAKELDELRVESNRSLSRCKDRADSMRRFLQSQISELERQLIQSRAQCKTCQKDRDEIRQRMQIQINSLQENFELVEIRLRALQNQVLTLKNSCSFILSDEEENNEFVTIS